MKLIGLNERLSSARNSMGMTKADLARKTGLSNAAIGFLESGESRDITGANVFPIADALNVSARWLLTGKEPKPIDGPTQPEYEREDVLQLARHLSTLDIDRLQAIMLLLGIKQIAKLQTIQSEA